MGSLSFRTAVDEYTSFLRRTKAKAGDTIYKEELALEGWAKHLVDRSLKRVTLDDIRSYASDRAEFGASNRTINLDVIALKNLLRWYQYAGKLKGALATDLWQPLKHTSPVRKLIPNNTVERFCAEATRRDGDGADVYHSGQFIADLVRLLAYSGARKTAALNSRWSMVNWETKQISFLGKYDKTVTVDFNTKLEAFLTELYARREVGNDFMFPGETFDTVVSPYDLFNAVRDAIGLGDVTLHDFRHWFISRAIMSGVDTMTIARWVGHADGGVLIGKVYGHLNNRHLQESATKMVLDDTTPVVTPTVGSEVKSNPSI